MIAPRPCPSSPFALAASWALFALLAAACSSPPASATDGAATADADSVAWRPASPRQDARFTDEDTSPNVLSPLDPGTRFQLTAVPSSAVGIPLAGGVCLPALNGVPKSGPIDRPAAHGAIPPVVGVVVDEARFEWYEHADGSLTTSRYVWNQQQRRWLPMTFHAIARR